MQQSWRSLGIILAVVLIGVLVFCQGPAGAATERIRAFHSHIIIHPDASMTVTETISVLGTGQEIKRGIVREFPTTYKDRYGNTVRVGFEIIEIHRDGQPEPYHTEKVANGVKIFMGQRDVFLQPGQYTYTITYKTDRQLGFFQDYDELYWNVTGNGWTFPIDSVQAAVQLPPGTKIKQYAAYTGPFGAKAQDYRVSYDSRRQYRFYHYQGPGAPGGIDHCRGLAQGHSPAALRHCRGSVLSQRQRPGFECRSGFCGLVGLLSHGLVAGRAGSRQRHDYPSF